MITISDESRSDKNASLLGVENFQHRQHAYDTLDYREGCPAKLLAGKRGQKYKLKIL